MCLAIPGKILSIEGSDPLQKVAKVDFGGIVKEASLACLPNANVGHYVLVHVGIALSIVDEKEAHEIFQYLKEAGELADIEEK